MAPVVHVLVGAAAEGWSHGEGGRLLGVVIGEELRRGGWCGELQHRIGIGEGKCGRIER